MMMMRNFKTFTSVSRLNNVVNFAKLPKRNFCHRHGPGCSGSHGVNTGVSGNTTNLEEVTKEYLRLIEGNKQYAEEKTRADPNYFKNLAKGQSPKYLMIGCSDSRIPPNEMTKTEPGDIFIHRNIANQVISSDLNCMSVIQFAVEYLKVEHVIVMGHTKCGGVIASANTSRGYYGLIEQWLQSIKDVAVLHKEELDKCANEEEYVKLLTELNVKQQALNVCKTPFVQKAWAQGQKVHVHGWIMDIETGRIKDLTVKNEDWHKLRKIYTHEFKH